MDVPQTFGTGLRQTSGWVHFLDVHWTFESGPAKTSSWVIFLDVWWTFESGPGKTSEQVILLDVRQTFETGPRKTSGQDFFMRNYFVQYGRILIYGYDHLNYIKFTYTTYFLDLLNNEDIVAASYSACRLEGGTSGASLGTEVGSVVVVVVMLPSYNMLLLLPKLLRETINKVDTWRTILLLCLGSWDRYTGVRRKLKLRTICYGAVRVARCLIRQANSS